MDQGAPLPVVGLLLRAIRISLFDHSVALLRDLVSSVGSYRRLGGIRESGFHSQTLGRRRNYAPSMVLPASYAIVPTAGRARSPPRSVASPSDLVRDGRCYRHHAFLAVTAAAL